MRIPGVFLCLFFACIPLSFADCGQGKGALVKVARVVDGDTLRLADGQSLRVIGINAPEIRRGAKPGQPLGVEARTAAQAFIDEAGGKIRLGIEQQKKDRYGRLLAHVYNPQGQSLGAVLLSRGIVFAIAVPPNIEQIPCLFARQDKARDKGLGIWGSQAWSPLLAMNVTPENTGFWRVQGRVDNVVIKGSVWIELKGNLVIQVARNDWQYFPQKPRDWHHLKGKTLEIAGWITARQRPDKQFKPLVMRVRSPYALRVVSP